MIRLLALPGSLRKASWNHGLLRAARDAAGDGITVTIHLLEGIPRFNQDLEGNPPEAVRAFKRAVADADGVLIATPEYNYAVSGVLKNALDWASRPTREQPFSGKPVGIISAGGRFGGLRAQLQLRQIGHGMGMLMMTRPELYVDQAASKFDAQGNLTDTATRDAVAAYVQALAAWTQRLA